MDEFATQLRLRPRGIRDGLWVAWRQLTGRPLLGPSCPRCGYPAEGLARPQCPECECDLAKSGLIDSRINPRLAWGAIWLVVSIAAAGALARWATPALQRYLVPIEVGNGAAAGLGFNLPSAPARMVRLHARTPPFRKHVWEAVPERIARLELSTDLRRGGAAQFPGFPGSALIIDPVTMRCTDGDGVGWGSVREPPTAARWRPFNREALAAWLASAGMRLDTPAAQADADALEQLVVQAAGLGISKLVPASQKLPITAGAPTPLPSTRETSGPYWAGSPPRWAIHFREYVNAAWLTLWLAAAGLLGSWVHRGRLRR